MYDYKGSIESKLPNYGNSIFSHMSMLAAQHQALNLSQGFPDFDPPAQLTRLVNEGMKKGFNQYAAMAGYLPLREKIAELISTTYSAQYHPESEITITPGATLAIYAAISTIVGEDDEVIIIEPAYDSYVPAIKLNGGRAVFVEMQYPDYSVNWDYVKKLISFRTKAIIINTPHNPTGRVLSTQDMHKLQKLTENTDITIISDEVYEHIIFDGREHQSVARFPKLAERSFLISSFGKTYHTTGWKMGYVCAPARLTQEFRKIYQFMAFSAHSAMQYAFAEILKDPATYQELKHFYKDKKDYFLKLMKGSGFKTLPCEGTYFQLLNYTKLSKENDLAFCERLVKDHGIAAIPVSVFYSNRTDEKVIRVCFAKKNETLERGAELLHKIK